MKKQKSLLMIPFAIAMITLLAVSCNYNGNTLRRPVGQENINTEDNGEVAGTKTVQLSQKNIKVGTANVNVEVADTDAARAQGLSDRKNLENGYGMLFDFTNTTTNKPGFWMQDMLISIDIIWINKNKIVGITPNISIPAGNKNLETYYPPSEITHVLEVPAGWSAKTNLKIGDDVKI